MSASRRSLWLLWAIFVAALALELVIAGRLPPLAVPWHAGQAAVVGFVLALIALALGVWTFALRESLALRDLRAGRLLADSAEGAALGAALRAGCRRPVRAARAARAFLRARRFPRLIQSSASQPWLRRHGVTSAGSGRWTLSLSVSVGMPIGVASCVQPTRAARRSEAPAART